jgi:hypothetical protein
MNERIRQLAEEAGMIVGKANGFDKTKLTPRELKFAQLIVQECASICEEMSAKCAGLPGDGALAQDCANYIRQDFGVEE